MGITNISALVANIEDPKKKVRINFMVDTGAAYTVLPLEYVKKLGLKPTRVQEFSLADGTIVKRKLSHAMVNIDNQSSPTTVVMGEKNDSALIGAITLEGMGLMVNPFDRKLIPMRLMLG